MLFSKNIRQRFLSLSLKKKHDKLFNFKVEHILSLIFLLANKKNLSAAFHNRSFY